MSRYDFAILAGELLRHELGSTATTTEAHAGLVEADDTGALDLALSAIHTRALVQALAHLDAAERIATDPPTTPTEGRNRLDRHQRNVLDRDHLLTVSRICRVLVLDAIKCGGAA